MKQLAIETFIKPMKINNISHGIAELAGRKLEIDLDNLCITFDKDCFNLTKIPGTKGAAATSFYALFVAGGVEYSISSLYFMVADHANKYISKP